ncbi:hypothetical protein K438DRAFT_1880396 [Mycena galopus ATCC 62051]|nr:hypothetical protein K438DRAFT_1880396 [Mycena galopus ATCC 62051]
MSLSDSPFANRLNTNYVPSDSEILQIRALLVDPSNELAHIDAQIKEMEFALTQLKEQRGSLERPVDAHKALISPMRHIPQDVLLEIFFSCLPSEHDALMDPAEAPLILGRICRHWRSVAYSTPMLWSSIHIPPPNYLCAPGMERAGEAWLAWLERSAACPLSVSLVGHAVDDPIPENHPVVRALVEDPRRLLVRLRRLTLTVDGPSGDAECFRPLLQLGPEDLPLLKSVQIRCLDTYPDVPNMLQVPTLEDVALCTVASINPLSLPLKWSRLTRLHLICFPLSVGNGGLDISGALELLRRCPNLVRCEIRVTVDLDDPGALTLHTGSIILPHLETLVFHGWACKFQKWIPHLVAPNLCYLQLGEVYETTNLHSSGHLRALIDPMQLTSSDLHVLLQSFPNISHLQLSSNPGPAVSLSSDDADDAFIALFCPPHNLCPMLTAIAVTAPCTWFSDAAALALVKARMAMPTPLRQFQVQFDRPMKLDIMPELQPFISNGLQVALEYYPPAWKSRVREGLFVSRPF